MALTGQEGNYVARVVGISQQLVELCDQAANLQAEWFANNFNSTLPAADYGDTAFPHLNGAKVTAAITALQAFTTALGDKSSGHQINLIKMR
jgi:hypothetical protein